MTQGKHTPGPWRAKAMGGDSVVLADSHKWHPYSKGYKAYPIAVPRKAEEPGKLFDPWCAGFSHDDARLVAAAPDMLKVLKFLRDNYDVADVVDPIIAKATGDNK